MKVLEKSIISWHCDEWDSETRKPETDPDALSFWMGRTLTCMWGCAQSRPSTNLLVLTRPLLLAVVCLPSTSSPGQSSCCIGGAGFPGIIGQLFLLCLLPLAQSFACLTAQLQDSCGLGDSCCSDAFLYSMLEFCAVALVVDMFLWLRSEVFLQEKCLGSAMLGEIHRWVK